MMACPLDIDPVASLPKRFHEALERLGPGRWSCSRADRLSYSRDLWPRLHLLRQTGTAAPAPPLAIVWPESAAEVAAILAAAADDGVTVVPFGGGSGVCGGTLAAAGAVTIDLKRMSKVLDTDAAAGLAHVQCGAIVQLLEDELNRRQLTLGHFPSSLMCATVGGCLAARSAGQMSSRYGKIEDMVASMRVALPDGRIIDTDPWGAGAVVHGLDWNELLVGSEGTSGVLCDVTLRVHPLAEAVIPRGFAFDGVDAGVSAMRLLMQSGLRPAVLRLYDEFDTYMAMSGGKAGADHGGQHGRRAERTAGPLQQLLEPLHLQRRAMQAALKRPDLVSRVIDALPKMLPARCLLVVLFEGPERAAYAEAEAAHRLLGAIGGRDLGPGPGERWLRTRYDVSFKQSGVFAAGAFVDTMEVATTWDRIPDLYRAVRHAIGSLAIVMAHFSHAYHTGCSIYFTFAGAASTPAETLHRYDTVWRRAQRAVLAVGATVSHHHGVGQSKKASMPAEHGPAGMRVLRALTRSVDTRGIMNPGSLGIADPPQDRRATSDLRAAFTASPTISVDPIAGTIRGPADTTLSAFEDAARPHGLTLRGWHRPFAVGGPVGDALQSGFAWRVPSRDGDAATRPIALCAVLQDGAVLYTPRTPRRAAGPEVAAALLCGGGDNATLSSLEVRAEPLPPSIVLRTVRAPDLEAAVEGARRLYRAGLPATTWIIGSTLETLLEGEEPAASAWDAIAAKILDGLGGEEASTARPIAGDRRLDAVSSLEPDAARFEIAARYSDLAAVAVRASAVVAGLAGTQPPPHLFHFGHDGGRVLLHVARDHSAAAAGMLAEKFPRSEALIALDAAFAAQLRASVRERE